MRSRRRSRCERWAAAALLAGFVGAATAKSDSVFLEALTSPELAQRIAAGTTTVLVPIGGTEQNGPHMVLGKHNVRVHVLAGRIAATLGNAIVAPVLAYVPEGSIEPPAAHMRYAGTISIPEAAFEAVLEATARSFQAHGLRDVVFLGDHGGYQRSLERVAAKLNRERRGAASGQALALGAYYAAAPAPFAAALRQRGFSAAEIGSHAGLADTSLALAVDPSLVRADALPRASSDRDGVAGDPRRASAELGELGVRGIVEASVAAIRAWQRR